MFKDRADAGVKLAASLKKTLSSTESKKLVVLSLLRGGAPVGEIIAEKYSAIHLPLPVSKISSPFNPELAIGALCFEYVFTDPEIVRMEGLTRLKIREQIQKAQTKFESYLTRFGIGKNIYKKLKGKVVVLVDDGIATGATVKAAYLFIRSMKPTKIILAVPGALAHFNMKGFDDEVILIKSVTFNSVSQFYELFPQVTDEEVNTYYRKNESLLKVVE